jgi:hypothetical protein
MNYVLTVTTEDLLIISEALGDLSFKKSSALISKLQGQINEQQKPLVTDAS